jgi:hypothetical protein
VPSFLLYDSTSTGAEKYVRNMCLLFMVEGRLIIYTLIKNAVVSSAMRAREHAALLFTAIEQVKRLSEKGRFNNYEYQCIEIISHEYSHS